MNGAFLNQWIIEKGQLTITQDVRREEGKRWRGGEKEYVIPDLPVISTEVERSQITKYDEMIHGFIREILFIKYFGKNISNFEIKQSRITGILYF